MVECRDESAASGRVVRGGDTPVIARGGKESGCTIGREAAGPFDRIDSEVAHTSKGGRR